MLPYPADMVPRARPRPASAARVRGVRVLMLVAGLCGLLMAGLALGVFLTQGSQVRVLARGLCEQCHPRDDLAYPGSVETRCDAAVRFPAGGRTITTTVTDAFPSEFSGAGRFRTIDLRYVKNDPAHPFKQSNYMPAATFVVLLVAGCAVLLLGYWGAARARW